MSYELLLTRGAETEVERTIDYLAKRSPQGAAAWCEQIETVLAELKQNPSIYGLAPESATYNIEIRQSFLKLGVAESIAYSSR